MKGRAKRKKWRGNYSNNPKSNIWITERRERKGNNKIEVITNIVQENFLKLKAMKSEFQRSIMDKIDPMYHLKFRTLWLEKNSKNNFQRRIYKNRFIQTNKNKNCIGCFNSRNEKQVIKFWWNMIFNLELYCKKNCRQKG